MSDLVAIIYPTEQKAEEVRQRLFKLQREYLISIKDAVIAVKNDAGSVKLSQLFNTTARPRLLLLVPEDVFHLLGPDRGLEPHLEVWASPEVVESELRV